jgi:V8-like Glu-specific endopeptidase
MRRLFRCATRLVAVALFLTAPAAAQEGGRFPSDAGAAPLRGLHTADDMRDWEAVGRLDTGVSFCTATLIAPDRVLTAAHCLFSEDGLRLPDSAFVFSAGLRHGRAEAIRQVVRSDIPVGYVRPLDVPDMDSIAQDVAILRLDRPVSASMVRPIGLGAPATMLSAVTLVSYGAEREDFPSIEENCRILSTMETVQVLSCRVVSGSSGAPVMRMGPDGPEIVAVVSGRSELTDGDVTVAVVAEPVVPGLMAGQQPASQAVSGGLRGSPGGAITIRRVGDGGASREGLGARFIRP